MSAITTTGRENRLKFDERVGAYLVDVVIYVFLIWVLGKIFTEGGGFMRMLNPGKSATLAFILLYLLEAFKGASIGKMVLGQVICNADGSPASAQTLWLRFGVKTVGSLLLFVSLMIGTNEVAELLGVLGTGAGIAYGVGCWLVLGVSRMGLHDRIAKTAVFKAH
ncbi:MAG: RDD family protein [Bacteroidetes bacterium]|nr:RDD family protein [Bacteroidota bacterium]